MTATAREFRKNALLGHAPVAATAWWLLREGPSLIKRDRGNMKRTYRTQDVTNAWKPAQWSERAAAVAVTALALTCLAPVRGEDHQHRLSIEGPDVIKLMDEGQNSRIYDLAFSPRRNSLVCAFASEGGVRLWDLAAKPRMLTALIHRPLNPGPTQRPIELLHPIAFSSDGCLLAIGFLRRMQIWNVDQRKLLFVVPLWWSPAAIRFSAADGSLVVGSRYRGLLLSVRLIGSA